MEKSLESDLKLQERRINRLEKLEKTMISTIEDILKRNTRFKDDIIGQVDNVQINLRQLEVKLEEVNGLVEELLESINLLEKGDMKLKKQLAELERGKQMKKTKQKGKPMEVK